MTFFEATENQKRLANLGRAMMDFSEYYGEKRSLRDITDEGLNTLNQMSHVGNMLTKIGSPFGTTERNFTDTDRALITAFVNNTLEITHKV